MLHIYHEWFEAAEEEAEMFSFFDHHIPHGALLHIFQSLVFTVDIVQHMIQFLLCIGAS